MRVFQNFHEAKGEIARDLNELGTTVFAGYQSKSIETLTMEERTALTTKELQNYGYVVVAPRTADLHPTEPWTSIEWTDRLRGIEGKPLNPGRAWQHRRDIWGPLLESDYRFSYTYSERLCEAHTLDIVKELVRHPTTRQAYIAIWQPILDGHRLGKRRVPCSLGYHILIRDGRVHMTYTMRSSDFTTHFDNDVWLALQLQNWITQQLGLISGSFTHILNSLHVYAADVAHVF